MCAPVRADTRRGGRRRKDEWGGQSCGRKKKEHQQKEDRKGKRAEMSSRWRGICGAGRGGAGGRLQKWMWAEAGLTKKVCVRACKANEFPEGENTSGCSRLCAGMKVTSSRDLTSSMYVCGLLATEKKRDGGMESQSRTSAMHTYSAITGPAPN